MAEHSPDYFTNRRAAGLCLKMADGCTQKARPGMTMCESCSKDTIAHSAEGRRRRLAIGLCAQCSAPRISAMYCEKHLLRHNELSRLWKAARKARSTNRRPSFRAKRFM